MAGAGLIAIKRRIKSVTNTKKITKAMGLVATAKLRKTREELMINDKYYSSLEEALDTILNNITEPKGVYLEGNKSHKKLLIVLTSDTGLCGGFNVSAVDSAINFTKENPGDFLIMVVGQKGRFYFNKVGYKTAAEYVDIPDIPTIKEAKIIYNHAISLYREGEVGEVYISYSKFISPVKQITVQEKLLPIEIKKASNDTELTYFEPSAEQCFDKALYLYLKEKILNCMLNAKTSEHGSRMAAMDGATKNANDLIDKLNLRYNRVRQSAITQEISEIVGGAQAQK